MWWPAVVKPEWDSALTTAGHHMGIQNRGCKYSLELLLMSGVPLETCWAFNKRWNNKLYYKLHPVGISIQSYYDARVHEYQTSQYNISCLSHVPCACYKHPPFYSYWPDKLSNIWRRVQIIKVIATYMKFSGARGGAVGWGTTLHAGRSRVRFPMVSLEFFIDINLPAALWPWGWLSL